MTGFLRYERHGPVMVLTMDRPTEHNALTGSDAFEAFEAASQRINHDDTIRAVILTGEGRSFCAGGNIKDMAHAQGLFAGAPYPLSQNYRRGIQRIPLAMAAIEVPTIAAVNGPAIGAGCDLACMCDIRIASTTARFAESFVTLGIVPGDGGAWLLPRSVGRSRAAEMAFTGDPLKADDALAAGLVSRVVPGPDLVATALELAQRIARNSGPALRLGKRLMQMGERLNLPDLLEVSAAFQALAHHTDEHRLLMREIAEAPSRKTSTEGVSTPA